MTAASSQCVTVGSGPDQQSFVDYLRAARHPCLAGRSQPAGGLPLDDRVGHPAVLLHAWARSMRRGCWKRFCITRWLAPGASLASGYMPFPASCSTPRNVDHELNPGRLEPRQAPLSGALRGYLRPGIGHSRHPRQPVAARAAAELGFYASLAQRARRDAHAHLDDYKNRVYIEGTRLMRAFAALFIATSGRHADALRAAATGSRWCC